MAKAALVLAPKLGFEAIMFNLVYDNNKASLKLWRELGFTEIGIIPRAGKMKDGSTQDAHMFYFDLLK